MTIETKIHRLDFKPSLEEVQGLVKGFVEIVHIPSQNMQMFVNEEGLLHGLPHNPEASQIAGFPIVGDVVILVGDDRWVD